jgi:hypothetical protein
MENSAAKKILAGINEGKNHESSESTGGGEFKFL